MGGFSPRPDGFEAGRPIAWYGEAIYGMAYVLDEVTAIWGVVLPAPDGQETWQQETDVNRERDKLLELLSGWPDMFRELISNTDRVVKFGLYDRPELLPQQWFADRCVLVGDAAHPTSPHHGQGANQSLEDCWILTQLLPDAGGDLSTESLHEVFLEYAEKRQPRTAMLVKGARVQGQLRVTTGKEACQQRNETVKAMWADKQGVKERFGQLFREPFNKAGGIQP